MLRSTFLLLRMRDQMKGFDEGGEVFLDLASGLRAALGQLSQNLNPGEDFGKEEPVLGKDGKPIIGSEGKPMMFYKTSLVFDKPDWEVTYVKANLIWWERLFPWLLKRAEQYMRLMTPFDLDLSKEKERVRELTEANEATLLQLKMYEKKIDEATDDGEKFKLLIEMNKLIERGEKEGIEMLDSFYDGLEKRALDTLKVAMKSLVLPKSEELFRLFDKELD